MIMSDLKASPRQGVLGAISDALRTVRDKGNEYEMMKQIPLIGGQGIGDLFMGKSPEEVNEWSYGNAPFQMTPEGTGSLIPQLKTGRGQQLADAMFTGTDVAGLGAGMGALGKYGARKAAEGLATASGDMSRRSFLQKAGGLGAAGAVSAAVPGAVRSLSNLAEGAVSPVARALSEAVPTVATVAEHAAPHVAEALTRFPHASNFIKYFSDTMNDGAGDYAAPFTHENFHPKMLEDYEAAISNLHKHFEGTLSPEEIDAFTPMDRYVGNGTPLELRKQLKKAGVTREHFKTPEGREEALEIMDELGISADTGAEAFFPEIKGDINFMRSMNDHMAGGFESSSYANPVSDMIHSPMEPFGGSPTVDQHLLDSYETWKHSLYNPSDHME